MSDSTPADNPVLASLEHAASLLTPKVAQRPTENFVVRCSRCRILLLRILRPYWWQQRQIQRHPDRCAPACLAGHRARDSRPTRTSARPLEAVWSGIHLLESVAKDDQEWLHQLQTYRQIGGTAGTAHARIPEGLAALQESVATFQRSAAAHLEALDRPARIDDGTGDGAVPAPVPRSHTCTTVSAFLTSLNGKRGWDFAVRRTDRRARRYVGFEDIFRGTEPFVSRPAAVYLPLLKRHARVLEIGCGRGEMLDLLREAGVPAIGVDAR